VEVHVRKLLTCNLIYFKALYYSVESYERNDYSIFGGTVRKTLPKYIKRFS